MRRFLSLTAAWLLAAVLTIEAVAVIIVQRIGYDSHAYWMAWQGSMYGAVPGVPDAYLYSPAFAQVLRPFALLPWPASPRCSPWGCWSRSSGCCGRSRRPGGCPWA